MGTFLILMMFYTADGEFHMQTRRGLVSIEHCRSALEYDLKQFAAVGARGLSGQCLPQPDRPTDLPEPSPIVPRGSKTT